MSVQVSDSDYGQFVQLLAGMVSPDGSTRTQAETAYFGLLTSSTDAALACLARAICDTNLDSAARMLAYMNLKNCTKPIAGGDFVPVLGASDAALNIVKGALMHAFEHEADNALRYKLLFCVAAFGGILVPQRKWDELMAALFTFGRHERTEYSSLALRIIATLTLDLVSLMQNNVESIVSLLQDTLSATDRHVRAAVLELWSSLLTLSSSETTFEAMRDMLPAVLANIIGLLEVGDEEGAVNGLDGFIAVAETDPLFMKPHLGQLLPAMLAICENEHLGGRVRRLAMEFIVQLAESRVGLMRRAPGIIERVVPLLLRWMTQVDDDPLDAWEADEEDEFDRHVRVARDDLDRLALAYCDEAFTGLVYQNIAEMLGAEHWQVRHAGLLAAQVTAEGLSGVLEGNVANLLTQIEPLFADPHPRVRWIAAACLGQMSIDLGPSLQTDAHEVAMRCIVRGLSDSSIKVRAQAASILVNFCEQADVDVTALYADMLLGRLDECLQMSSVSLQEWALTAMASIASSSKTLFGKYVNTVMPVCMNIIRNASSNEHRQLRGKAFEAATFIGVAVGRERFEPFAAEIAERLTTTDLSKLSNDDPQVSYLIESSTRLAEVLGEDFAPYLPRIMPSLMQRATCEPFIRDLGDAPDAESRAAGDAGDDDDEWDYHEVDGSRYAIHQPSLEDKADALSALARYAEFLRGAFAPYVTPIGTHIIESLQLAPNERVRETSASILPFLATSLGDAAKRSPNDATAARAAAEFGATAVELLCVSINEESNVEFSHLFIQTLCELLLRLFNEGVVNFLDDLKLRNCIAVFNLLVDEAWGRREERAEERADEDHDEDLEASFELEEEQDTSILVNAVEMIENVFKTHRDRFVPYWRELLPRIGQWLSETPLEHSIPLDRHLAVCLLDDVVEHGGEAGLEFFDECFRQAMRFSLCDEVGVRQAALYGLGACAQAGGARFSPHLQSSLDVLWQTIDQPNGRQGPMAQVIENAVSAVGKVLLARPNELDVPSILPRWLSHLPIVDDDVEAAVIYKQLVRFASLYPEALFGSQNFERLPFVLNVMGSALETKFIDTEGTQQFADLLRHLQTTLPGPVLESAMQAVEPVHRARLLRAIGHEVAAN